jgi:uncharacterized protein YkwD
MKKQMGLRGTIIFISAILIFGGFRLISAKPRNNEICITIQGNSERDITIQQIEDQVFNLVNEYRKSKGLPSLKKDEDITEQARIHSREMAEEKVEFGHEGFNQRISNIRQTLSSYEMGGENIFECSASYPDLAKEAMNAWLASKGHRENIEGTYILTGIGVAQAQNGDYYFTQIFINGKK